ncbi:hypothetical protein GGI04_002185 [Coemansia thaxteri]|nr:hypothetical protein GGI04_002185 [Coemansia thaxteri]KAJ2471543.1 hypothetical protein GGI02_002202 [Coemansia sp. RSA 2322]
MQPCAFTVERKEVRDLTQQEWGVVQSTVALIRRDGWFQWFSYIHEVSFSIIHGTSQFFPFHRRFLRDFEMVGQRFNPRFAIPYWNEFSDYRSPALSAVLNAAYLGGNGRGVGNCVSDGLQSGWTMSYPNSHCLSRKFNQGAQIQAWYTQEYVSSVLQRSTTMAKLRPDIEYTVHRAAHVGLGGDMSTRTSTNDMVFMVHHAFIDYIWSVWQSQGHQMTIDGAGGPGQPEVTLASAITYYNEPVQSVMQLGRGLMCYRYTSTPPSGTLQPRRHQYLGLGGVVEGLARILPARLLHKWFPGVNATSSPSPGGFSRVAHTTAKSNAIPLPIDLSVEWVYMHGYDLQDVQRVDDEAREFVRDMNMAGYAPLY